VLTYRSSGEHALEALGDPTRRSIFELLLERPQPVHELADALPVSRPAISQHLKVLKQSGLVIDRADGTRRIYRVEPSGVTAMREYIDQMWATALAAFGAAVESRPSETDRAAKGEV
jgi:DNA-binding transcriptional ArsR family regulator